ncbi:MAG: laminin G domain-containing protein, partial [Lentisphaerae bacterium]|nr:laminin G domain-containing protein [Lentisphaerota bacterium]
MRVVSMFLAVWAGLSGMVIAAGYPEPLVEFTFEEGLCNSGELGGVGQFVTNNGVAPVVTALGMGHGGTRAMDNTSVPAMGGEGGYLRLADNAALDGLQSLTIALWYKPAGGLVEFTRLVSKRQYYRGYELFHGSGGDERLGLYGGDDDSMWRWANSGEQAVYGGDGGWVFAAASWDLASGRMDIYGGLEGSDELVGVSRTVDVPPAGTAVTNASDLVIGAGSQVCLGRWAFKGLIDNVRVWGSRDDASGMLTAAEIERVFRLPPNPLVEFTFEDGLRNSGTLGGTGQFVTNNGAAPCLTGTGGGLSATRAMDNTSVSAMGEDGGYLRLADIDALDGLQSLSMALWYKPAGDLVEFTRLIGKRHYYQGYELFHGSGGDERLGFYAGDDNNTWRWTNSGDQPVYSGDGRWVFAAGAWDLASGRVDFYAALE